jgi:tetratricopeptide (TPR) repeat protein
MLRWLGLLCLVALAGLAPVLLAIAVNVATGGDLPSSLQRYETWAWPAVAVLSVITGGFTAWQLFRKSSKGATPVVNPSGATAGRDVNLTGNMVAGRDLHESAHTVTTSQKTTLVQQLGNGTFDSIRTARVPSELPNGINDFVGRSTELDALRGWLTTASTSPIISTIHGRAGVGKSTLAVQIAQELRYWFPDGQLYVNLRGADSNGLQPIQALNQLLRSLGFADKDVSTDREIAEKTYRTALAGKRIIILLDNAVDEVQVRPLLPGSAGCAVLVTSRIPLNLEGATSLALGPMSLQEGRTLIGGLAGHDRIDKDPDSVEALVVQCDFLPLALRIAGVKLATRPIWTVADLVRRWSDERRRLEELQVGDLAVRTRLRVSYEKLEATAATIFRRLALLEATDYSVDVAAILSDVRREEASRYIEHVVDAQLLELSGVDRYRFRDLLRVFAREEAEVEDSADTRAVVVARALQYYGTVVRNFHLLISPAPASGFPASPSQRREALAKLEDEQANLVAVVRQAANMRISSEQDYATVLIATEMAKDMFDFFRLRRNWSDWQVVGTSGLHAARRAGDRESEGVLQVKLGAGYFEQGQLDMARRYCEQSTILAAETADRFLEGSSLNELGLIHRNEGRYEEATACFKRAISISRELRNPGVEGKTLNNLGLTYELQGYRDKAVRCYRRDLFICRATHDIHGEAETLLDLGKVYHREGNEKKATSTLRSSRRLFGEVDDRHGEGWALYFLGLVAEAAGSPRARPDYWEEAISKVSNFGDTEADRLRALIEGSD